VTFGNIKKYSRPARRLASVRAAMAWYIFRKEVGMNDGYHIPRPDHKSAKKVEQALAVQAAVDTMAAAQYLRARGIDFAVALRVLTRPSRRRASN
jgi:hypothetical protein